MEYVVPALAAFGVTSIVAAILFLILCIGKIGCYCNCCERRWREEASLKACKKCHFTSSKPICSNETCPVCLDDFNDGASIVVTPCCHGFHRDCLLRCKQNSPNCPLCKVNVFQTSEQLEASPLLVPTMR